MTKSKLDIASRSDCDRRVLQADRIARVLRVSRHRHCDLRIPEPQMSSKTPSRRTSKIERDLENALENTGTQLPRCSLPWQYWDVTYSIPS